MTNVDSAACAEKAGMRDKSVSIQTESKYVPLSQILLLGSSFLGANGKLILLFLLNALRCRTASLSDSSVLPRCLSGCGLLSHGDTLLHWACCLLFPPADG